MIIVKLLYTSLLVIFYYICNYSLKKTEEKEKYIKLEKELLKSNGKPVALDFNRDLTYDLVQEPTDMFSREI